MTICFRLDRRDYSALQKMVQARISQIAKTNSCVLLFNVAAWIPIGVFVSGLSQLYRDNPHLAIDLSIVSGALALGVAAVVASNHYWRKRVMKSLLAEDSWFLNEQEIHVLPEGLFQKAEYGEAMFKWSSFRGLEEDSERLVLFLDNAQGLVIPKSAIQSQEKLRELKSRVAGESAL